VTSPIGWLTSGGPDLRHIPALGDVPAGLPRLCPNWTPTPSRRSTPVSAGAPMRSHEAVALSHHPRALPPLRELFLCSRGPRARSRRPQLAVLVGYGEDPLVEAFWTRRFELGLIERLADQQWTWCSHRTSHVTPTNPAPSTCSTSGATWSWRRARRCGACPRYLTSTGARKEDLDRYLAWAEDVSPPALAVNLQTFRTEDDWVGTALPGLTYLSARACPSRPSWSSLGGTRLTGWRTWAAVPPTGGGYCHQKPVQAPAMGVN